MSTEYAALSPGLLASEAIAQLRREAPNKETIYYSYVIDKDRGLLGFVSLKDLILARPDSRVDELMRGQVLLNPVAGGHPDRSGPRPSAVVGGQPVGP